MIPGLENAEFARYGVMHRNIYVNAPKVLDGSLLSAREQGVVPCWADNRRRGIS